MQRRPALHRPTCSQGLRKRQPPPLTEQLQASHSQPQPPGSLSLGQARATLWSLHAARGTAWDTHSQDPFQLVSWMLAGLSLHPPSPPPEVTWPALPSCPSPLPERGLRCGSSGKASPCAEKQVCVLVPCSPSAFLLTGEGWCVRKPGSQGVRLLPGVFPAQECQLREGRDGFRPFAPGSREERLVDGC